MRRRKSSRKIERKSRILADADLLGDEAAAAKHGISTRTLRRYRKEAEPEHCPPLAEVVLVKRQALSAHWLEEAKKARMEALARGLELARGSDNLRDVTGFLKIVHDAVLADEMLNAGAERHELDRRGDGLGSQEGPDREVQGRPTTH